jgi:hypothetical protein
VMQRVIISGRIGLTRIDCNLAICLRLHRASFSETLEA